MKSEGFSLAVWSATRHVTSLSLIYSLIKWKWKHPLQALSHQMSTASLRDGSIRGNRGPERLITCLGSLRLTSSSVRVSTVLTPRPASVKVVQVGPYNMDH